MSHVGIDNVQTHTMAHWINNMSYATIDDYEALVDMTGGTASGSSKIQKNQGNPSVVRGTFILNDYWGTSSVTRITELYLYPGTLPTAAGKIAR